jgi:hypothetical protein
MTQPPNGELQWYFQDSAAACGQHGHSMVPSTGGGTVDYHPSDQECRAARRVSRIERALAELRPRQVELLKDCYTAPTGTEQGYRAGDGAVLRAWNISAELQELEARFKAAKPPAREHRERLAAARVRIARDTMGDVKGAHRDYVAVRRRQRQADRALVEGAKTLEQRRAAHDRAEPPPPGEPRYLGRADAAIAVAEAMANIGEHPLAEVRAAVAEANR